MLPGTLRGDVLSGEMRIRAVARDGDDAPPALHFQFTRVRCDQRGLRPSAARRRG
jgi:hypothetical protein